MEPVQLDRPDALSGTDYPLTIQHAGRMARHGGTPLERRGSVKAFMHSKTPDPLSELCQSGRITEPKRRWLLGRILGTLWMNQVSNGSL